jgi:hypothetical protein
MKTSDKVNNFGIINFRYLLVKSRKKFSAGNEFIQHYPVKKLSKGATLL